MTLETQELENQQRKQIVLLLPKEKQEELAQILEFWERYKKEWKKLKDNFWNGQNREEFLNLIAQYEESEQKFVNWLSEEEKEMLEKLKWIRKEKFYREYLFDRILYGWNLEVKCNEPMEDNTVRRELLYEWREWNLQPWTMVKLDHNQIDADEVKILVRNIMDKLHPWVSLDLSDNNIWDDWTVFLAQQLKWKLQQWMAINLWFNHIGKIWALELAKQWKDNLQPWMTLDLGRNQIWDEWANLLVNERKMCRRNNLIRTYHSVICNCGIANHLFYKCIFIYIQSSWNCW